MSEAEYRENFKAKHFLPKVQKTESGCWTWTGLTTLEGYARTKFQYRGGIQQRAHRVAHILFIGPIPKGKVVMHLCNSRTCVNPDHICFGTNRENSRHMVNVGRQAYGERNGLSKLTNQQVAAIRASYDGKYGSIKKLSASYGVCWQLIYNIIHRRSRKIA